MVADGSGRTPLVIVKAEGYDEHTTTPKVSPNGNRKYSNHK